ncbi:unnamed protein product [Urochloa humidicola]
MGRQPLAGSGKDTLPMEDPAVTPQGFVPRPVHLATELRASCCGGSNEWRRALVSGAATLHRRASGLMGRQFLAGSGEEPRMPGARKLGMPVEEFGGVGLLRVHLPLGRRALLVGGKVGVGWRAAAPSLGRQERRDAAPRQRRRGGCSGNGPH